MTIRTFLISIITFALMLFAPSAQARFLQTDPIGYGDGLNWYAYVKNDPLNGTDPSGKILVIPLDDKVFAEKAQAAVDKLTSKPAGAAAIGELIDSDRVFTIAPSTTGNSIRPTDGQAAKRDESTGGTIKFNPDSTAGGENSEGSNERPAFIGLAHEVGHAQALNKGEQSFNRGTGKPDTTPPSETKSLETENAVRKEHNEPLRPSYVPPK